jgi:hypothetical protein
MRIAGALALVLALWLAFGTTWITFEGARYSCGPTILGVVPSDPGPDFTDREMERSNVCIGAMIQRMGIAAIVGVGAIVLLARAGSVRRHPIPPRPDTGG